MIVDNELYLLRKVWATASTPLWKDTVWYHHSTHTYVLSSIAVGTAGRMFWHLIFLWQSESYRLPLGLLYVYFVSIQPTIPVPSWLVCHLPQISKNGKFASLFDCAKAKKLSVSGGICPWPSDQGSDQGLHRWTACQARALKQTPF